MKEGEHERPRKGENSKNKKHNKLSTTTNNAQTYTIIYYMYNSLYPLFYC